MEENIIGLIAEAERDAAARKAQAQAEAAMLTTEAERRSAEIVKASEEDCRRYRDEALRAAEAHAAAEYEAAIEKSRREAKAYADGILEDSEIYIREIVGRLTK